MKKERKPVPVVEEAPYEGPTIFDKVIAVKEVILKYVFLLQRQTHTLNPCRFSRRKSETGVQWRERKVKEKGTGKG